MLPSIPNLFQVAKLTPLLTTCTYSFLSIFNICPNSNLTAIGFGTFFAAEQKLIAQDESSLSQVNAISGGGALGNCPILDTSPETCASTYDLPIEGTKWWNPFELPADVPGTQALSDTAGSVTVPPWGATPTVLNLFPSFSTTITPAAFNVKNAGSTATATAAAGTGSGGTAETGTSGGSGNTASGSATTKSRGNIVSVKLWTPCLFALPAAALACLW
jgi:hypothetical protein